MNFAAAIGGEAGVAHAIAILQGEIYRNMALLGIDSPAQMRPEHLIRLSGVRAPVMPL